MTGPAGSIGLIRNRSGDRSRYYVKPACFKIGTKRPRTDQTDENQYRIGARN